jgi:AcrR family transcriptional regulator
MGRAPDPTIRDGLVRAAGHYVLEHGLADLSLRPLAEALGTSPRMLLYHFGTKEELVMAALDETRKRQAELLTAYLADQPDAEPDEVFRRLWVWLVSPEHRPFLRLFLEVYALSLQYPERFPSFAESDVRDILGWRDRIPFELDLPRDEHRNLITLLLAAHRGLYMDLLATGDRERVDRAQQTFMQALAGHYEREEASHGN